MGMNLDNATGSEAEHDGWLQRQDNIFNIVCIACAVLVFGLSPIIIWLFVSLGWLPSAQSTHRSWADYYIDYCTCCGLFRKKKTPEGTKKR